MRKLVPSLGVILLFVAVIASAHYPATIKIDEAKSKQPAVTLDHAKHGDTRVKNCGVCHHTQKDITKEVALANKVDVKKCSTCHLDPKSDKIPSMREMSLTKNPFHIRCIGCHKEGKKGPTVCKDCHKAAA
jgi:hypothetical protein